MKNLKSIAFVLLVALSTLSISAQNKKIDVSKSSIHWVGKKVTGQHEGTMNFKEGSLVFKSKKLVGGTFTVDMNSLTTTDLKAGKGKEDLEGHLKSADFFGTDKFPTATLVFKTISAKEVKNTYEVTADMTIKGITSPIKFDVTVNGNVATTKLVVDRTKFDIKYKSKNFFENLGDKTIYDDFELEVALNF